ncbi:MAG: F0F1 ATP synthase subunit delta, partial [Gammaproteobacteria bacterium]
MIKREEIARPYAKAAFEFATEQHQVPQWASMLQILATISFDTKIAHALRSPQYDATAKATILLEMANDLIDDHVKNFVRVLAENHRVRVIPEIYRQFILLQEAAMNVVEAEIITPQPLSPALKQQVILALEKRSKAKVQLHNRIDEKLLGGAQIRIGDELIDGSILGKLQRLAHYL